MRDRCICIGPSHEAMGWRGAGDHGRRLWRRHVLWRADRSQPVSGFDAALVAVAWCLLIAMVVALGLGLIIGSGVL